MKNNVRKSIDEAVSSFIIDTAIEQKTEKKLFGLDFLVHNESSNSS